MRKAIPGMMMYEIFDWHRYDRLCFVLCVMLRTESVGVYYCYPYLTVYLAFIFIDIVLCIYSVFNQHS